MTGIAFHEMIDTVINWLLSHPPILCLFFVIVATVIASACIGIFEHQRYKKEQQKELEKLCGKMS